MDALQPPSAYRRSPTTTVDAAVIITIQTGAIVAAEIHAANEGDTTTLPGTLAVAEANLDEVGKARRPTRQPSASLTKDTIRAQR